mgnify:CR=1 FL=1
MEQIKTALQENLTKGRYEHVLRVCDTAEKLALKHGVSAEDARLAALLHDYAKCMAPDTLRTLLIEADEDVRLFDFHHELWHGPAGAYLAKRDYGVTNKDVLNAVRYHTTGRANMSLLEKLIFVADLIEPGRQFPGIEKLREAAEQSIEDAMQKCIGHSIQYLATKRAAIFPDSLDCYNEYMLKN